MHLASWKSASSIFLWHKCCLRNLHCSFSSGFNWHQSWYCPFCFWFTPSVHPYFHNFPCWFILVTVQRSRIDLIQINSLFLVFFLDADGPNSQSMAAVMGRQDYFYQCILYGVEILSKQCLFILKCRQRQKYHQCANCAKPTVGC